MRNIKTIVKTPQYTCKISLRADYLTLAVRIEQDRHIWLEHIFGCDDPTVVNVQFSYLSGLLGKQMYPYMSDIAFMNSLEKLNQRTFKNWLTLSGRYDN